MLPRYHDADGPYEIVMRCRKCGWSMPKDSITQNWTQCPMPARSVAGGLDRENECGAPLSTARVDYYPPFKITYAMPMSAFGRQ